MDEADEKALEAAARALAELHVEASLEKGTGWRVAATRAARKTITAYLAAAGDGWREERDAALREAGRLREALQEVDASTPTQGSVADARSHITADQLATQQALADIGDIARAALRTEQKL